MPIEKYFGGHGDEVMSDMQGKHGAKKGKQIFYATANKRKQGPDVSGKSGRVQHGSLLDIEFHEEAAQRDTVMNDDVPPHPMHKGYDYFVAGQDQGWEEDGDEPAGHTSAVVHNGRLGMSANRDNGYGIHYGAPVDYFGPDTDYRAEEIDPSNYGRSYEPYPFRDYFKTDDKMEERTFRLREQDEYDTFATPGAVTDNQPQTQAYGAVNYQGAGPDGDDGKKSGSCDNRSFESQMKYLRANKDAPEYDAATSGLDTKKGDKIR